MDPRLQSILVDQAGVVARRQVVAHGLADHDIARMVRRRELTAIHPGVYVDHTGPPTWLQRAWAAVLFCWPAALSHESALLAAEGSVDGRGVLGGSGRGVLGGSGRGGHRGPAGPVEVAIAGDRRVRAPDGVVVRRTNGLSGRVLWNVGPPRVRYEEAVVDVAARAGSDFEAIEVLARGVRTRMTTPDRLADAIARRSRIARRGWLTAVLRDIAEGACSVLEHGYLTQVERAHGLARPRRQVVSRTQAGLVYRDVEYTGGLVVELDGRLFHDSTEQRDHDLDRDLLAAADGRDTVRLSWGQVYDRPCRTAGLVASLLVARGWPGQARRCGPSCDLRGNFRAPAA